MSLHPKVAELFEAGCGYIDCCEFENARDCFGEALKIQQFPELYTNMGNAYKGLGQVEAAVMFYEKAIESLPKEAALRNELGGVIYDALGVALMSLGRLDDAYDAFLSGLLTGSNLAGIYGNLGSMYISKGEVDNAVRCFDTSIELEPNAEIHCNLIFAFDLGGRRKKLAFTGASISNPSITLSGSSHRGDLNGSNNEYF